MTNIIEYLKNPKLYPHEVTEFNIIETHLSWILLTGQYAYKVKKPVNLGFVDYSSLEKRKFFCEQELKLNQKLSNNIYLEIVPIKNDNNEIIEYIIKMQQFKQEKLLKNITLNDDIIISIAEQLATFHNNTNTCKLNTEFGNFNNILQPMLDNFTDCFKLINESMTAISAKDKEYKNSEQMQKLNQLQTLKQLQDWTTTHADKLKNFIKYRKQNKFIKHCHGDLHLGNIVMINNQPTIFDCIEFNPDFYWIDIINDTAFFTMDLLSRQKNNYVVIFLNQYLAKTQDYSGLRLLNFYMVYRAMVRAKVILLTNDKERFNIFASYLSLATSISLKKAPRFIITYGVSGSGKSFASKQLSQKIMALHIRSDIERKILVQNNANLDIYSETTTELVYEHLCQIANDILISGWSVIIDATFLKQKYRQTFLQLADSLGINLEILACSAKDEVLKQRITTRKLKAKDPSDADLEILQLQQQSLEPLTKIEQKLVILR